MDNFYEAADPKSISPDRLGTMVEPEWEELKMYSSDISLQPAMPDTPVVENTPLVMTDEGDIVHRNPDVKQIPIEEPNNGSILDKIVDSVYNVIYK